MNSLVSIVLPTYNGSKFIKQTIDSCLCQTYSNFELIIINDCSTDHTEDLIREYQDSRIKYFKNEQNLKLPKSLNVGFEKANGDLFTWISDDNYFSYDALEKMVAELKETDSDLVCGPYFTIDNENNVTGTREVGPLENILLDNIVKACFLYKREIHKKLKGYSSDLFLVEDYDFWIRTVFNEFKLTFLSEKLYYYRFHDGSLTENRRKDIARALFYLLEDHLPKFQKSNFSRLVNSKVFFRLAKIASGVDDLNGRKYLLKAVNDDFRIVLNTEFLKIILKSFFK
jgi:glycosyltransferase involved in cell wall biosynthesis